MVQLVRITAALAEGFEPLRAEAAAEGHRHMDRLAAEHAADPAFFKALLAAFADGELMGVGGVTEEPELAEEPAWRMRRLYVRPAARRLGIGRTLASALLQEALDNVRLVTVRAGGAEAARFWEALSFAAVEDRPWSHELRR